MTQSTTNFAIQYPESTDYVKDGASAMETIAERVDDVFMAFGQGRNRLINGDFRFGQRGTSFTSTTTPVNNDNTYLLDRWVLLSDGNDIVDVTRATTVPTGGLYSCGLDVETANKKFGILQIIEQRDCIGVQDKYCTLSFSARTTGTSIANLKAVVLSWTGTADAPTRDVVSAWNADGVTPSWATSWTAENTPVNLNPSNTWTRYTITPLVDTASIKNIAVFIWCDDMTTTVGDFLYITDVQFEVGAMATPFERRSTADELQRCQRYYEKSYDLDTVPGSNTSVGGLWAGVTSDATSNGLFYLRFATSKRTTPSVSVWRLTGASGTWQYERSGVAATSTTPNTADYVRETGGLVYWGSGAAYVAVTIYGHWAASAEF